MCLIFKQFKYAKLYDFYVLTIYVERLNLAKIFERLINSFFNCNIA